MRTGLLMRGNQCCGSHPMQGADLPSCSSRRAATPRAPPTGRPPTPAHTTRPSTSTEQSALFRPSVYRTECAAVPGRQVTHMNNEEAGLGREAVAGHAAMLAERRERHAGGARL